MNREMIEIIQKSERVNFEEKKYADYKFYYIRGQYGKIYLLCQEKNNELEDTLSIIEKICMEDSVLQEIRPQFIYAIILKEVVSMNEQSYKDIIAIEENEYFCKKYVLYYEDKELEALKKWIIKEQTGSIDNLLNSDNCIKYMDSTNKEEKQAVNLLLRMIIKCPFIKYGFKKGEFLGFDEELSRRLGGVRKINKQKIWGYKKDFYDKLEGDNIDQMVDLFIQTVRKEME